VNRIRENHGNQGLDGNKAGSRADPWGN